jgi:hypothetical protein
MAYSDITFNDKNVIKRWLQQRRLVVATRLAARLLEPQVILDFGAGNGELCNILPRGSGSGSSATNRPRTSWNRPG